MTIQEVITASDTKFVELNRVDWLVFLGTCKPQGELVQTHRELTNGSLAATAETVIVYRDQAKSIAGLGTETSQ